MISIVLVFRNKNNFFNNNEKNIYIPYDDKTLKVGFEDQQQYLQQGPQQEH